MVKEVRIEFPDDIILVSEHEKARRGGMPLSVCPDANNAQLQEEIFILQCLPRMAKTRSRICRR